MVQLPSPPPNRPRPEPSGGEVVGEESIPFDMEDDDSPSEDFRLIKELASQILTQHDLSIIENMSFSELMQNIMQKSIAVIKNVMIMNERYNDLLEEFKTRGAVIDDLSRQLKEEKEAGLRASLKNACDWGFDSGQKCAIANEELDRISKELSVISSEKKGLLVENNELKEKIKNWPAQKKKLVETVYSIAYLRGRNKMKLDFQKGRVSEWSDAEAEEVEYTAYDFIDSDGEKVEDERPTNASDILNREASLGTKQTSSTTTLSEVSAGPSLCC